MSKASGQYLHMGRNHLRRFKEKRKNYRTDSEKVQLNTAVGKYMYGWTAPLKKNLACKIHIFWIHMTSCLLIQLVYCYHKQIKTSINIQVTTENHGEHYQNTTKQATDLNICANRETERGTCVGRDGPFEWNITMKERQSCVCVWNAVKRSDMKEGYVMEGMLPNTALCSCLLCLASGSHSTWQVKRMKI